MPKFDDYTQKTTPEDTDITLILDKTANVNKKTPFSGIWTWIVNKMTNAVIQNLQTTNKTVIGSINELNSNTRSIFRGGITNLDNAPYSHILECGENPVGMPSQLGNSCMVFQFNPQTNYSAQLAFSFEVDKIAIRRKNGVDDWSDWKYFTAS